jgi:hypothetical protein
MIRKAVLVGAISAAVLTCAAGSVDAQQLGPGGPGKPSCYEIRSALPFTVLTHVILPSRARSVARVEPNRPERHCLQGDLFPDGRVNFRIVSGLGPPLFSCQTKIEKPIFISGKQDTDGGWSYDVTCY